jgi:hypothetical protein
MSGPKVVRIVTHEEVVAVCRGLLASLDAALEEWVRVGQRNETLTGEAIGLARQRRDEIRALLEQDRLTELQKAALDEVAFLRRDQQARLVRAAEAKAARRAAERRTASVARVVLARLEKAGRALPADLRDQLEGVAAGRTQDSGAISRAFALLGANEGAQALSEHQRRLAGALREDLDRKTLDQWIASQPEAKQDEDLARLEARVAELSVLLGEAAASAFETRLRALSEAPDSRRGLLVDSLHADLSQAVANSRAYAALQGRLRGLAAELAEADAADLKALARELLRQIESPAETLEALEQRALAARDRFHADIAARARRQAILSGLAALGYQVSEQMETAWAQEGRVVLRKISQPGYGVEIGGADAARFQVRTVAFRGASAPSDPVQDADAETLWCGDLQKLQAELAARGGAVVVERALPVGAVPLKVIADTSARDAESHVRSAPEARQRTLGS